MLWPLYEFNKTQISLEQLKESKKKKNVQPKSMSQNLRTGKNPKLFCKLDSIKSINSLHPLLDGGRKNKLKINYSEVEGVFGHAS